MFKNAFVYQIAEPVSIDQALLEKAAFSPCTELQIQSMGWSPIVKDGELTHEVAGYTLIKLRIDTKNIPNSAVKKTLIERIEDIEAKEDRKLSRVERAELKDQIVFEMLPHAFITSGFVLAYMDAKTGIIVVDGSSAKKCETLLSFLRKTLGSLPVTPYNSKVDASRVMTDWLKGLIKWHYCLKSEQMVLIGNTIEIASSGEEASSVKLKNIDLNSDQVTEHLDAGGLVIKIDVNFGEKLTFILHEDLSFHRIKSIDTNEVDESCDSEIGQISADLILFAGTFAQLFGAVDHLFGVEVEAE